MNKIFKIIWSKARNCYVVVSELAKSHDDGHVRRGRSGCARKAAVLAAFVLTTSLLAAPDWAQAADSNAATNKGNASSNQAVNIENKNNTTAQGTDAYATYDSQGNLIMGKDNEVVSIQKDPKTDNARVDSKPENVVLGTRNGVGKFTHSTETKKPISGDESYAYQKLDTEWITVEVYNPDTNSYDDKQVEVYKLTPGQYMDDEYNVRAKYPTLADYNYNQEAYTQALNVYNSVANYLNDDRTRQSYYVSGATAVGVDNVAEGDHSTAIGNKAKVLNSVGSYYVDAYGKLTSDQNAAYYYLDEQGRITTTPQYVKDGNGQYVRDENGYYIKTNFLTVPRLIDSTDAVAIGSDVTAEGRSAVAIGHQSYAKEYSVAIGENSVIDYMGVAIGKDNKAKYASTAIGHTNDANGYYTATMGVNNTAHGDYSSAIGYQNTVDAIQTGSSERKAYQSHVLGSYNTIKGDYNLAAGDNNSIDKISGMAVGVGNKISMDHNPDNSNPINLDNQSGDYSIAVGLGNKSEKNALVIGKYSSALHDGSIAIGNSVNTQSNNGATDSIAIGTGSQAMTKDSIAFGHEAKIGNNNSQGTNGAIAIGKGADAENGQSLAIGYEAYTGNNKDVATNKDGSIIAIGTNAQAMAGYDIAIGAKASTASSKTSNSGGSAVAICYNAVINDGAQRSVAMGANASVALNVQDAVALGSQSYVEQNQGANHQGGYDPSATSAKGIAHGDANSSKKDPVWNSTLGPISVGSASHWDNTTGTQTAQQTRQITNVAAGKNDTDAVNVAQLKQVVTLVNQSGGGSGTGGDGVHYYSVSSNEQGDGSNYNNDGATGGTNAMAAGVSAKATGANSTAVGKGANATGESAVAIGNGAKAEGKGATVIGQYAKAKGDYATAFGGKHYIDKTNREVTLINEATGIASTAFGEGAQAKGEASLAFGHNTVAGVDGGNGQQSVAFGENTQALGGRSLAFGENTRAEFNDSVAFGNGSQALSTGAMAHGNRTSAVGQYTTTWGNNTVAAGENSTAFGKDAMAGAIDENGAVIVNYNNQSTKIDKNGYKAYVDANDNTQSGTYTVNGGETHNYVILAGTNNKKYICDYHGDIREVTSIDDNGVITAGNVVTNAPVTKIVGGTNGFNVDGHQNATAFGNATRATAAESTAWGQGSIASGEASTAFGIKSKAEGKNSLAGLGGQAVNENSIALGKDTKANNAKQAVSVAIGENAEASGERSLAIGFGVSEKVNDKDDKTLTSTKASGESAIAIGTDVVAQGQHSVAMGSHTDAAKDSSVAIGFDTHTVSDSAVAIGSGTKAAGRYSVALGLSSVAGKETNDETNPLNGGGSVAIGYGTSAEASRSVAIGTGATAADAEFTTALGDSANAQQRGSVAIGAGSVATRAAGNKEGGTEYKEAYLIPDVSKATDAEKATWTSTEGAVSVGGTAKYQEYDENGHKVTKTKLLTRQITNVAAGSLDTDAVNVAQLKKMSARGLDFQGNNDVTVHRDLGQKLTIKGEGTKEDTNYSGENLKVIGNTDGSLTIKMDKDIKGNSVTVGEKGDPGTPGKDGVDGTIGVNGKDGSAVVINGKDGSIGLNGKDGANGLTIKGADGAVGVDGTDGHDGKDGMTRIVYEDDNKITHEVATLDDGLKYAGNFGDGAAVKLNKTVNIKGILKDGAKETDFVDGNIAVVAKKSQNGEDGELLIKMNKDLNLGNNGSVKMGNTTINNGGVTIQPSTGDATKSVSLTNAGLDNGGNKITNVADGEISDTSKDAVNGSQLNTVKTLAGQHTTVEAGSKNISVTESTNDAGGKKYTVDLAKNVTFGDASKGDKTVTISGTNGTITAGTGDNKVTVDGSNGQIVAGGNNGVKIGKIANGDRSLTIYDKDGKATDKKADGGQFVTNLDNKTWNTDGSYVSGRAATEDQLHQVESNVNKKFDDVNTKIESVDKHHTEVTVNGGTAAKADGSYTDGNLQIAQKTGADGQKIYDLKLSDNLNIGGAGKEGAPGKDGHMGINGADGKSGVGIDGKDGISIKGADGKDGVTIKGVVGKDGTEGHIGLTGAKGADGKNAAADIHVKNGQVGVDGTDGHGGKDGMDRVVYEDHNHITHEVATMDDGMKYSGDSGNAAVKLNKNVQIYGGATEYADGNNIGVVASQDGDNAKLQVKLAKDLKGLDSVTTGDTTINNSGLTVKGDDNHKAITIQQGNVNMGGNTISGVADGKVSKDSTDAVNGSQLWQRDQAINGLSGSVNKLGNRINRVGAGAAALAALHPLDFDPDDKWDFAAGYGNYRGANAAAIGAYYRPNEDTMFSVGGSFGGGENMVNAGVSIKLGQGNHVSTSRVAMAKEMKAMRQHMAEQDALIAKLQSMHGMAVDPAKSVLFPDVAENHWAYQYVTTLAKKGILEGYPDGEFKGDRMMTRYEFAAIVYRIVESGVGSTDPELSKLVKEFSPELQYIRIDTIQKDRNGKPTIERVRVISDAK